MAKKHTLLVVDDEADVCDSVYDLLRREFQVLKARDAAEAMKIMAEQEVDIIMTDQRMPQVTGVEFLTRARSGHPHAVRMLFTGYADLEAIIAAINQGHVFRFLRKPWRPEDLELAVREAAEEFERLVAQEVELEHLRQELQLLRDRVAALEKEMVKIQQTP